MALLALSDHPGVWNFGAKISLELVVDFRIFLILNNFTIHDHSEKEEIRDYNSSRK